MASVASLLDASRDIYLGMYWTPLGLYIADAWAVLAPGSCSGVSDLEAEGLTARQEQG